MNLAGGSNRSKTSEIIGITQVSPVEERIGKPLLVHTVVAKSIRTPYVGPYDDHF